MKSRSALHFAQAAAPLLLCWGVFAHVQPVSAESPELQLGRKVYNYRCYFCHGYSGDANTVASAVLNPPPRNFQTSRPESFSISRIESAVREGIASTAMSSFQQVLREAEIRAVAKFVRSEFIEKRARNTAYHTPENGWPDHQRRYASAFPYVTGAISLDLPATKLDAKQQAGRALYIQHCITCHDRGGGPTSKLDWYRLPQSATKMPSIPKNEKR